MGPGCLGDRFFFLKWKSRAIDTVLFGLVTNGVKFTVMLIILYFLSLFLVSFFFTIVGKFITIMKIYYSKLGKKKYIYFLKEFSLLNYDFKWVINFNSLIY